MNIIENDHNNRIKIKKKTHKHNVTFYKLTEPDINDETLASDKSQSILNFLYKILY